MTTEKPQQVAEVDANGPQAQESQHPDLPQNLPVEHETRRAQDQVLPAGLIQVEEQTPPPVPEKVVTPPAKNPHMEMPPIYAEPEPQMVTPLSRLTATPTYIDCPFCMQRAQTNVSKEGTSMQTMAAALCCLFCVCAVCVPYMCHWFEDTHIYCSRCKARVATIPHDGHINIYRPTDPAMVATIYQ
ncbi:hypothetical protein J7T55_000495 [Diaporthe amygdali]|uniref:uncharacterized protein n=1 Tax=Phomopsis amygdali TaxID=1214568 RepID=UPI0022FE2C96|nr:uncharacterized protein J7T55_000495 [Diaporthe amygdali]KAJ0104144.1 hypothetical protein J7T55_000495 [Diaporthe amygdali]